MSNFDRFSRRVVGTLEAQGVGSLISGASGPAPDAADDLADLMWCGCGERHGLKECPALKTEPGTRRARPPRGEL